MNNAKRKRKVLVRKKVFSERGKREEGRRGVETEKEAVGPRKGKGKHWTLM